ncbi:UNVERIFIED_CONTAM: hypothetical protein BEN50_16780 [Euhalothece sp. KZN 001]
MYVVKPNHNPKIHFADRHSGKIKGLTRNYKLHFAEGDTESDDSGGDVSNQPDESSNEPTDTGLKSALEKERKSRKQYEKELKEQQKNLEQLREKLAKFDEEEYESLKKEKAEREEQELLRKKEFDQAKKQYLQQAEENKKLADQYAAQLEYFQKSQAIKDAFVNSGGITEFNQDAEYEDIPPVQVITQLLQDRVKLQDGQSIVLDTKGETELDSEGNPKSLSQKMIELKRGSMGALFRPESTATGTGSIANSSGTAVVDGKTVKVYTKEQARQGKVPMADVASGKAIIK